ncbi:hypothetical protein ACFP81_02290 [Deinococcus lacus]|uniref:Tyr recombinase domain-containing protein n=1 Tax=Deinococcus lacus TaxID=392561 RepID=A0ABW1YDI8_9DEIO
MDDLDPRLGQVLVRGKGGKSRVVPLGAGTLRVLDTWLEYRRSLSPQEPALLLALTRNNQGGRLSTRGHAALPETITRRWAFPKKCGACTRSGARLGLISTGLRVTCTW